MSKNLLIQALIDKYGYRTYLELGCFDNHNFNLIQIPNKTGVDIRTGGTLRLSTNQFFKCNRQKYDIIFIDADHTYEASRSDLAKSLKILNDRGCIVLHDTMPIDAQDQAPSWNGEVWRTVVEYRSRSDLQIITVNTDFGCTLIFQNPENNCSTILIRNPTFEQFRDNKQTWMNLCEPSQLIDLLPNVPNKKNIAITTNATWGRIGHQFTDLLTSYIISHIFNIPYTHLEWTGEQAPLNAYLPIFKSSTQNEYTNHITIKQNVPAQDKFQGITLDQIRQLITSAPDNTLVQLTESTFYSLNQLYQDEQQGRVLPGIYDRILKQLRQSTTSITGVPVCRTGDTEPTDIQVRGFIRTGGSIRDLRPNCMAYWTHNKRIVDTIHAHYKGKQLHFKWYSQGPVSDLIESGYDVKQEVDTGLYTIDFNDGCVHQLVINDDNYPQLAQNIIDILSADIAITGYSSFSQMTSILRTGPNYSTSENMLCLGHLDIVVEPFKTLYS